MEKVQLLTGRDPRQKQPGRPRKREKIRINGYLAAVVLMLAAAVIEVWIGVKAERTSLEEVAEPLSVKK